MTNLKQVAMTCIRITWMIENLQVSIQELFFWSLWESMKTFVIFVIYSVYI